MGGAPPHTDNRIRQAARGEEQVGLLKNNAPVANLALELSLEHGVALGMNIYWLVNISWIALVTSLPARAFTWTLASTPTKPTIQSNSKDRRHNSKEPRTQRLQTRGEPFLWRHAAASTYHVFPPESTRRRTNQPTWFPRTKTRATHLKETKQLPTCFVNKQVPLTKSILLIELVKSDLNAVTEHKASVVIFSGRIKR